jgi:hypothetical protein
MDERRFTGNWLYPARNSTGQVRVIVRPDGVRVAVDYRKLSSRSSARTSKRHRRHAFCLTGAWRYGWRTVNVGTYGVVGVASHYLKSCMTSAWRSNQASSDFGTLP